MPASFGSLCPTEADENPILECGAKFVFAVLEGFAKADDAR